MSGLLSLRWNNHCTAFVKKISKVWGKEQFSDAIIVCHGKYYHVHKLILSTCSEYFEEIFESITFKQHSVIIINDIKNEEMKSLLHYMYEGEVNVLQDKLPNLMKAAEALKIKGLAVPDEDVPNKKNSSEKRSLTSPSLLQENKKFKRSDRKYLENIYDNWVGKDKLNIDTESLDRNLNEDKSKNKNFQTAKVNTDSLLNIISAQNINENQECQTVKVEPIDIDIKKPLMQNDSENMLYNMNCDAESTKNSFSELDESLVLNNQTPSSSSSWLDMMSSLDQNLSNESEVSDDLTSYTKESNTLNCRYCGYKALQSSELEKHINNEHQYYTKRYSCNLCSYSTNISCNLKIHLRTHTGEKPFKCNFCPFKASHLSNLKVHVRSCEIALGQKKNNFCFN